MSPSKIRSAIGNFISRMRKPRIWITNSANASDRLGSSAADVAGTTGGAGSTGFAGPLSVREGRMIAGAAGGNSARASCAELAEAALTDAALAGAGSGNTMVWAGSRATGAGC